MQSLEINEEMNFYNICALFSGCGGLDLGFELYNDEIKTQNKDKSFRIIWANDFDYATCCSYNKNFFMKSNDLNKENYDSLDKVLCKDVRKLDFKSELGNQNVDIILGGFPCQDFSVLRGNREDKGIKVKRGRLYLDFVRALYILEPKVFVAENVAGLVSANNGYAYQKIIEDFTNITQAWKEIIEEYDVLNKLNHVKDREIKYHILFNKVIDFSNLGVPQKRKRLIIIGLRNDLSRKLQNNRELDNIGLKIDDFLTGRYSIFKSFPLTPLEVFEGVTLDKLNEKYVSIMKKYEKSIEEIDSERKNYYYENIWKKLKFDIIKDYFKLNLNNSLQDDLKSIRKEKRENSKGQNTIDKWLKKKNDSITADQFKKDKIDFLKKEYEYPIESSNILTKIIEAHKCLLKELGYLDKPVYDQNFDDHTQDLLSEIPRVSERMNHVPPYENFQFVWGTEYQVKGLMSNVYRRIHPLIPALTVIGKGGGGTWGYHYEQSRQRLTHRERARLQTFPDSFEFCGKSPEIRAQIGNAVPPLSGKRIAETIYYILEKIDKA